MIRRVSITNYALINDLSISFGEGLTIITGETGAGKSIVLGAIGLVLGQRADGSALLNANEKCVCEIEFDIAGYALESFFKANDLDYQPHTILRREIAPGGKSRAFINDTPVNLTTIRELGLQLVDVHSQHQTLLAEKPGFQLSLLDSFAGHTLLLDHYQADYRHYQTLLTDIARLETDIAQLTAENDYRSFVLNELTEAKLSAGELEQLEDEYRSLTHAGEIREALWNAMLALSEAEVNSLSMLNETRSQLSRAAKYLPSLAETNERTESVYQELKDLASAIAQQHERVEADPERLNFVRDRIDLINKLLQKHRCATVAELITLLESLESQSELEHSGADRLKRLKTEATDRYTALRHIAAELSTNRTKASATMQQGIEQLLTRLGMPKARFEIRVMPLSEIGTNGADGVRFLFSANEGFALRDLADVASGGELSRFMLALKAGVADKMKLPTIVFDEIDTGVSGEIAGKVGALMREMAAAMQVVNITHLPQVAARGHHHLLVYKASQNGTTFTSIRQLTPTERQQEIARMLSGETITEAALQHAGELLAG